MSNNNFIKRTNKYKHRIYPAKNILSSTLNNQPYKSSEIKFFEFPIQNQGTLSLGVFTAHQALPVKGAEVTVYDIQEDGTEHIHAYYITDENGRIPDVELPVKHDSQHLFGSEKYHFTTYNIRVTADKFYPVNVVNFRIFPNMKTIYSIDMLPIIPGETVHTPEEILEIPSSVIDGSNFKKVNVYTSNFINYSQNNENIKFIIPGGPPTAFVTIPETITVHLGRPDEVAENYEINFIDYIKNVASSELYPTWPENALRANIHAIVSVALNRYILQWYRAKGYNFDITNSTQFDQAFVKGRGIYESIDRIVNEIFNDYVIKNGQVIPLFTTFCDGRVTNCNGLSQWGTVDLAEQGFNSMEILKYYYGENISLIENAPVGGVGLTYPGEPLMLGDSSIIILRQQLGLNRIAINFPAIPQIIPTDGYYGESTENAVREFQRVFNLLVTGIIDKATFYKIRQIYVAVSKLSELAVTGSIYEQIIEMSREAFLEGDIRPSIDMLQYLLDVLSSYYHTIPSVAYTGIYDEQTKAAVIEFQKRMGLPITGIVNQDTFKLLIRAAHGIFGTLPPQEIYLPQLRFPGLAYRKGHGVERPGIIIIQEMLAYISLVIPTIPIITEFGVFGEETEGAVIAFQQMFGLAPTGVVDEATWNELIRVYRQQRYGGLQPTI